MMQLITPEHYGEFVDELTQMHRLRYRVFKQRLDWDVQVTGDMDVDEFDSFGQSTCCIARSTGEFGVAFAFFRRPDQRWCEIPSQFFWTESWYREASGSGRAAALLSMFPRMRRNRAPGLPPLRTSFLREWWSSDFPSV
ncbi:hypothetical protein ABIF97_004170 [Bradyrhizobium japonicum]